MLNVIVHSCFFGHEENSWGWLIRLLDGMAVDIYIPKSNDSLLCQRRTWNAPWSSHIFMKADNISKGVGLAFMTAQNANYELRAARMTSDSFSRSLLNDSSCNKNSVEGQVTTK